MIDPSEVERAVVAAIDDYNQQVPDGQQLRAARETVLFGKGAALDSMGLVNLILCVEQRIAEDLGHEVAISDDRAMSRRTSPFRTMGTLVDYVAELLGGKCDA